MKSKGNGNAENCANNLLMLSRGEVPYDRIRGLSTSYTDKNSKLMVDEYIEDARKVLEVYEPRINVENIEFEENLSSDGHVILKLNLSSKKGE